MSRLKNISYFLLISCMLAACKSRHKALDTQLNADSSPLENGFLMPPDSIQTSVYWYWMSDNISREGVVKDLQAMKKVGVNRAFIGNIGYPATPYGKVKIFSDEWWEILHTALKTATALNIEIGIFNSPGWSQSGGPWVKPAQSMRYLSSSQVRLKGGRLITQQLAKPDEQFQDVKVIAFKAPEEYQYHLSALKPKITTSGAIKNSAALIDGDYSSGASFSAETPFWIDFATASEFTARSIVIYPARQAMKLNAVLQVMTSKGYETIKEFVINRSNPSLNVGFDPYGPVAVSIPATKSKHFRIVFSDGPANTGIAEIEISASPRVDSYIEKTLAKMFQTPLPYWKEYQWKPQPVVDDQRLAIDPKTVIDISSSLSANGLLKWNAPAGDWIVMRTGMVPTKVTNSPASPEGTGLEVDKMSREHVQSHFDAFTGEILRRIPAEDRKTWRVTVQDSYETGGQNWTDDMQEKFRLAFGYDPLPYLPVLKGMVVGSQEIADRFLWDLRRFIADRVAYDYVGGLRDISHKHGLHTWLENYGHWGFPGEFLQYGGQSDEIGGEFWSEGELGDIENRAASSAAHIYGKTKVSAESFTAGGKPYQRYPALMKQRGDRFFTEGINNTLLHVFIEQPTDTLLPGINADFGNEFNRHNTWFNYLDLFTSYLKRCNFMLQQGKYVADVAYFIGEDAPKMTGITDPVLPRGYSFDYINAEVIMNRVTVKDGRLVLPDGMSYSVLVLPKLETMRPELLEKIKSLVEQGATITGPAPTRSPSLTGYPAADLKVKKLVAELWNGAHKIIPATDMQSVLNKLNIIPDFESNTKYPVLFIHRNTAEGDIYFISNQTEQTIQFSPAFRIKGKKPELWDPVAGSHRLLPEFKLKEGATEVPLTLAPLQSMFIVFREPVSLLKAGPKNGEVPINFPQQQVIQAIASPWEVSFDQQMRGPAKPVLFNTLTDWTLRPEENIKYYSGTAIYRNSFKAAKPADGTRLILQLGELSVMAKVSVNGKDVGGVWTAPWQIDITDAVKPGENKLEISVVNTWVNRLIGDSKLPLAERKTWTSVNPYHPGSKLEPSGLRGPVTISTIKY